MIRYLGLSPEQVREENISINDAMLSGQVDETYVLQLTNTLENINTQIHAIEALGLWSVQTRFSFNTLKLGAVKKYEPFQPEDFDEVNWKLALEMGGLYLAYAQTGKNLFHVMLDNDFGSLDGNDETFDKIQFQDGFKAKLYVAWTLSNETEAEVRDRFASWWQKHDMTGKYGYGWGNRSERNGFVRLGQQICDPPTDCDRDWRDLLDDFAQTPIVEDLTFSTERPYGETEDDLRFLYPGDDVVMAGRKQAWVPISWWFVPPGYPGSWFSVVWEHAKSFWFFASRAVLPASAPSSSSGAANPHSEF